MCNIIQIQLGSDELWPRPGFWVYVHYDLDVGYMTLGKGHDTPLSHGQQLCKLLSRSDLAVRSFDPDTDNWYVCSVTLGQGHDTFLSHGQQLCEISSKSNMAVRCYGPDMDFWYVCTMTLTSEI